MNARWLLSGLRLLNLGLLGARCGCFLIFFLLLGYFMTYHATGYGTCHGMMSRHMAGYTADNRAFDTTFGKRHTLKQE